jgi:hypothetical protein
MYNGVKGKAFCMNEAEAFANEVGMSYIFIHKNASAAFHNSCSLVMCNVHVLYYITHTKNVYRFFSHEPQKTPFLK